MFFRLLLESFRRQRRRKLLAGIAIFLGTTAITAMLALATTIGDRIHRELAVYGANIIMTPQAAALSVSIGGVDLHPATGNAYLHESDLSKLQTIFWHNNITGVSPELSYPLWTDRIVNNRLDPNPVRAVFTGLWFEHPFGSAKTGAPALHPLWKLRGAWPAAMDPRAINDASDAVIGASLARRLHLQIGDTLFYHSAQERFTDQSRKWGYLERVRVTGVVETGDAFDDRVLLPLADAQSIFPHANHLMLGQLIGTVDGSAVSPSQPDEQPPQLMPDGDLLDRVEVSARTRPEDSFARKDPDTLSPKQRDLWYCRPYANSIAYQIHEAIPGARVTQLRQVEQTEGTILSRISGLMWLVAAAALLAAAFAVSSAMATAILERRAEIGLMRSLGASRAAVATLFYVESGALALFAGLLGYFAGSFLSAALGARVFNAPNLPAATHLATLNPVLLPVVLGLALLIALAGSTPPIRSALRLDPSATLRADA